MYKIILLGFHLFIQPIFAAEVLLKNASPDQIVKGFQRQEENQEYASTSRTLKPIPNKSEAIQAPISQSFVINFEFDSSEVRKESYKILQNISAAITSPTLEKATFVIEGHTDAVGKLDYNIALSKRRADSVKYFLIQNGVSTNRLNSVGKGPTELNDSANPTDSSNRRVKIIRMN
ncbi:OmpA family protein [Polynucleobacter rarus]|uniref:OmpA family protein n=1 Tax=Polynucleobacter rarus TaxID=556055 RepID=UPI000D3EB294|nr:OmpA family protein [Polynucleobacter rarus]